MTAYIDNQRTRPRFRPIKAIGHMRNLLRDKEDTVQVFHIMEALNGNNMEKKVKAFALTPGGRAALDRRRSLPKILDDHDTLKALPEGTVGRAYVDFMEREDLTAAGLVEESEKWMQDYQTYDDDLEFLGHRYRDTHDLLHVLTGYGRDQLGETSVLAFSHAHNGGLGNLFIAYVGGRDLAKTAPKEANVMQSIREARQNGKACLSLLEEDIVELLKEPLANARRRMNIPEPKAYKSALNALHADGYVGELSAA